MRGLLDQIIYFATAPIRLFGRSRVFRLLLVAIVVLGGSFMAANWALDYFLPESETKQVLAKVPAPPPLPPIARASQVIAPVAIPLTLIRQSLDNTTPRDLTGKNDNPVSSLLSKADIGISIARGPMGVAGKPNEITVTTPLNGTLSITGQLATQAGNLAGTITGLLGQSLGRDVGNVAGNALNQRAEIRGQVVVRSKPGITANWRLEPNLAAQLSLSDSAISLAGIKINMASEARAFIDNAVNEQIGNLQNRVRNDPFIEQAAREQ